MGGDKTMETRGKPASCEGWEGTGILTVKIIIGIKNITN